MWRLKFKDQVYRRHWMHWCILLHWKPNPKISACVHSMEWSFPNFFEQTVVVSNKYYTIYSVMRSNSATKEAWSTFVLKFLMVPCRKMPTRHRYLMACRKWKRAILFVLLWRITARALPKATSSASSNLFGKLLTRRSKFTVVRV